MGLRFNREQTKKFADTCSNLSLLFFGFTVAPFINDVDSIDYVVVASSGILACAFFIESIVALKGLKDEFKS